MKNTKTWQRVLSMAVCLCMIVGLVPAVASPASAADENYSVSLTTLVVKNASTYIDSYVDGEVESLMFLTPYTQYKLKLTSADKNTVYYADLGKSTDGGNTYSNGATYTNSNNTSIDQYQFGTVTFKEETYSIGYISKRGYFVATSEGTADITITALENGEEVASSTVTVRVVAKEKHQYNFRRGMKYIISGAPSGWRSANIPWTAMTNYAYTTVGDNMETVPEDKYYPRSDTTANYNTYWGGSYDYLAFAPRGSTRYPNQQTAPWKYAGSSSAAGEAVPSYANGYYGQKNAHIGEWVQFKIKVPSKGKYDITHYGSCWDEREAVTINGTAYSASANQQVYLAPVSVGEGSAAFADAYLLGTDDRYTVAKNGSGKNWNVTNTLASDYALEAGEYIVTFKKPATETTTALNIGVLSLARSDSPIVAAEIEAAKTSYELDEKITFNVSGTMIDGSEATLTNATYAYEVVSGNAVKIDKDGNPIASAVGAATVKVSVTLNGVTVSDTADITVTDNVLSYSYTYDFNIGSTETGVTSDGAGRYYITADYEHENAQNEVDWSMNYKEKGGSSNIRVYANNYINFNSGGIGRWFTVRINVKRPGWYETNFKGRQGTAGAKTRAYITTAAEFDEIMADIEDKNESGEVNYNYYIQDLSKYSIGTVQFYNSTSNYNSMVDISNTRKVYFEKAGEYALTLQTEEYYNTNGASYNQMFLDSFTIDRVAFADAAASTVLPAMNLSTIVPDTSRTFAVEDGAQKFAFIPTMASGTEYVDDLVGANATVVSSDTDVVEVSTVKQTNEEGAYGNALRTKDLVITPVAAGTANVTITAVRDGVTYTEVIPVQVTHNVANFGTHYAYIRETEDGEKKVYNLALIAGIDDVQATEYKEVGFEYSVGNGVTEKYTTQQVYSKITAGTNNVSVTASELGADYLFFAEKEIDAVYADSQVKFRAYATLKDGTTVYYGGWFTIDSVAKAAAASN